MKAQISAEQLRRWNTDIMAFLEEQYVLPETGRPIALEEWQRELVFRPLFYDLDERGLRRHTLAVIGLPKKHGKSTIAAGIGLWFLFAGDRWGEIIIAANDLDQASMIIYNKIKGAVMRNPLLHNAAKVYKNKIEMKSTGTICRPIAHQYETAAGVNPTLVLFDELWGFPSREFYDELTTSPARREPLNLIVTYAGYEKRSLLYDLYEDGMTGEIRKLVEEGDAVSGLGYDDEYIAFALELEVEQVRRLKAREPDPQMFFLWEHRNLASWITDKYLDSQRRRLPPNVYARFHENRWAGRAEGFITQVDVDLMHSVPWTRQYGPMEGFEYVVACDLGLTHDRAVRTVGHYNSANGKTYLDSLRLWEGTPERPISIAEVEQDLVDCAQVWKARKLVADPWQMQYVMQRLKNVYDITPFNFSSDSMLHMSQLLVNVLKDGKLVSYDEPTLDGELKAMVSRQTARGWRIDTAGKQRNDAVVTVGMMLLEAVLGYYGAASLMDVPGEGGRPLAFAGVRDRTF